MNINKLLTYMISDNNDNEDINYENIHDTLIL